jgi:hypothetical protein
MDFAPGIEAADGFAQVFPEHKYLIVEVSGRYTPLRTVTDRYRPMFHQHKYLSSSR